VAKEAIMSALELPVEERPLASIAVIESARAPRNARIAMPTGSSRMEPPMDGNASNARRAPRCLMR